MWILVIKIVVANLISEADAKEETMTDVILQLVNIGLPIIVAIWVPLHTTKQNRKLHTSLKRLDIDERTAERRFAMEKQVSMRSLETVQKSYYHLRQVNQARCMMEGEDEECRKQRAHTIKQATEYWENNFCYLPRTLRDRFVYVSNLAASCLNPKALKTGVDLKAGEEITKMFDDIKRLTAEFMDEWNCLDQSNNRTCS